MELMDFLPPLPHCWFLQVSTGWFAGPKHMVFFLQIFIEKKHFFFFFRSRTSEGFSQTLSENFGPFNIVPVNKAQIRWEFSFSPLNRLRYF